MPGTYKMEAWGAQGGNSLSKRIGGKGGYSWIVHRFTKKTMVLVYVGCAGQSEGAQGGWNGGANSSGVAFQNFGGGGGGSTDFRLSEDLSTRFLVAGGGGGAGHRSNGGFGGGTSGESINGSFIVTEWARNFVSGGNQTQGGKGGYYKTALHYFGGNGTLLNGGIGVGESYWGGGGGGGYYGGGGAYEYGSAGGSGCIHPLMNGEIIAGNETFVQPDGVYRKGHPGDGFARITKVHDCKTRDNFPKNHLCLVLTLIIFLRS